MKTMMLLLLFPLFNKAVAGKNLEEKKMYKKARYYFDSIFKCKNSDSISNCISKNFSDQTLFGVAKRSLNITNYNRKDILFIKCNQLQKKIHLNTPVKRIFCYRIKKEITGVVVYHSSTGKLLVIH